MRNSKYFLGSLSFVVLLLFFLVCGMIYDSIRPHNGWATTLFCFGAIVILASLFLKAQWLPVFTAGGYLVGFLAGVIFQRDYVTPGGDTTNDLWAIWLWTLVGFVLAGVLVELILWICRLCKARTTKA